MASKSRLETFTTAQLYSMKLPGVQLAADESDSLLQQPITVLKQFLLLTKLSVNYSLYEQYKLFEVITSYFVEHNCNSRCFYKAGFQDIDAESSEHSYSNQMTFEAMNLVTNVYKSLIRSNNIDCSISHIAATRMFNDINILKSRGVKLSSQLRYLMAISAIKLKKPLCQIISMILGPRLEEEIKYNFKCDVLKTGKKPMVQMYINIDSYIEFLENSNLLNAENESLKEIAGGPAGLYALGRVCEQYASMKPQLRKISIMSYIKCLNACPFMWSALERLIGLSLYMPLTTANYLSKSLKGSKHSAKNVVDHYLNREDFRKRFLNFYEEWGETGFGYDADIEFMEGTKCLHEDEFKQSGIDNEVNNYREHQNICFDSNVKKKKNVVFLRGSCNTDTLSDLLRIIGSAVLCLEKYECEKAIRCMNMLNVVLLNSAGYFLEILGRCYFELGKFQLAASHFAKCSQIDRTQTTHLAVYSTCLWHLGDKIGLVRLVEDALAGIVMNTLPRGVCNKPKIKLENCGKGKTYLRDDCEILKIGTSYLIGSINMLGAQQCSPELWCALGNLRSLQGESEEAAVYFRRAIIEFEDYAYAYTLCGHEYVAQEKLEEARLMYEKATEVDPRHYNAYCGLAQIKAKKEDLQGAAEYYRIALQYKKNSSGIYIQQGEIFELLGRKIEALKSYERAVMCDPCDSTARFRMGHILFALERHKEALTCYQIAEKLAPLEPEVHLALAVAYSRYRHTQLAWHHLHKTLHYVTDNKQRQAIRDHMLTLWIDGSFETTAAYQYGNYSGLVSEGNAIEIAHSSKAAGEIDKSLLGLANRGFGCHLSAPRGINDVFIYDDEDQCMDTQQTNGSSKSNFSRQNNRNDRRSISKRMSTPMRQDDFGSVINDEAFPSWTFVRRRIGISRNSCHTPVDVDESNGSIHLANSPSN